MHKLHFSTSVRTGKDVTNGAFPRDDVTDLLEKVIHRQGEVEENRKSCNAGNSERCFFHSEDIKVLQRRANTFFFLLLSFSLLRFFFFFNLSFILK